VLKYCTCMNNKMSDNETRSITQSDKTTSPSASLRRRSRLEVGHGPSVGWVEPVAKPITIPPPTTRRSRAQEQSQERGWLSSRLR
jgi:hypothetical protein